MAGADLENGSTRALGRSSTGIRVDDDILEGDGEMSWTLRIPSCPCELADEVIGAANVRPCDVRARICERPAEMETNLLRAKMDLC